MTFEIIKEAFGLLLDNENEQRELTFLFFIVFSRFEYALKKAGYVIGNEKKADVNWDCFAKENSDRFTQIEDNNLITATNYYNTVPPKKLVYIENNLVWDIGNIDKILPELNKLLVLVRRVRNNCFHGDKFDMLSNESAERNVLLIQHGLEIIYHTISCNEVVERFFYIPFIP